MSILFAGDFFFRGSNEPVITYPLLEQSIQKSSKFIVNLEGPICCNNISGIMKTGPVIIQDYKCLDILKKMNVNAINLANNHVMDGGKHCLETTLNIFEKNNIECFGIDDSSQTLGKPLIRIDDNQAKISIIGVAEEEFNGISEFGFGSYIIDPISIWRIVNEEKSKDRLVIVILHGGVEQQHLPPPKLRTFCHWLIDIGAITVVTHHPHVPGYIEIYNGRPIAWSLGNFWFSDFGEKNFWNQIGYIFELQIVRNGMTTWEIYPYRSDYNRGVIRELEAEEKDIWEHLKKNIEISFHNEDKYNEWWEIYIEKKYMDYIINFSLAPFPKLLSLIIGKIIRLKPSLSYPWIHYQLNGLRCITHRELWINSIIRFRKTKE